MIQYHEERMATVNRIIKQLWKLVYTGTDTTSIEIRTDATEGIGGTKRTYNYKLIQMKHGHEIDMKGRCSAGQKVILIYSLLSLILLSNLNFIIYIYYHLNIGFGINNYKTSFSRNIL